MKSYEKILEANKTWVAEKTENDPDYFTRLAASQHPEFLWIGCSDSRVPPNEVTGTNPGEIFVHRNVANLVVHTDMNLLSVLQYAVEVLKVKHILLVGHYNCGGVKASMKNDHLGLIDAWIRNIKDVIVKHEDALELIEDEQERFDRLVELNVIEQTKNLAKTSIVQKAWKNGEYPKLHGWVIDLKSGFIKQIIEIDSEDLSKIDPIYRFNLS